MLISRREMLQAALVAALSGSTLLAQDKTANRSITGAAAQFLDAVPASQRSKILLQLDDKERYNWDFVPLNDTKTKQSTRRGVALDDMNAEARTAAMALLAASTSVAGYRWSQDVMAREAILAEFEPRNTWYRKPGWYFVTIYGTPAATGRWGWRLDGHHLSVNCTVNDGEIVSSTPFFMGLNPVTIMHGENKGKRETITGAEDLARELYLMLTPDQQKVALQPAHLPEVKARTQRAPTTLPQGLSASKMTGDQQKKLQALVTHYTSRMPATTAQVETKKLLTTGIDRLNFAYTGEAVAGKRHTYVIQGPTLFIHYMNEQTDPHKNPANHIHSIYRSLSNDFGDRLS